uniref:hypothetical protein n=1 Tax=uncultured Caulobacter sp. TaxID=158749 RepID=UPI0025F12B83|nr:hypothetical protein [uncultured Caulobacter sp.]
MHAHCKQRADRHMKAFQRVAAETDARAGKKTAKGGKKEPSPRSRAASRAKTLQAGRPH